MSAERRAGNPNETESHRRARKQEEAFAKRKQEEREKAVQDRLASRRSRKTPITDAHEESKLHRRSPVPEIPHRQGGHKDSLETEGGQPTGGASDVRRSTGQAQARLLEDDLEKQGKELVKQEKRKLKKKRKQSQRKKLTLFIFTNFGCIGSLMGLLLVMGVVLIILGGVVAIIATEDGGNQTAQGTQKTEENKDNNAQTGTGGASIDTGNPSSYGYKNPVTNVRITSPYGQRWGTLHKGIDFGCKENVDPILASKKGKVAWAKFGENGSGFGGYGNVVVLEHDGGQWTLYGHMNSLTVQEGQTVEAGTQLGICGATGQVTGPHLHFEVKTAFKFGQVDPAPYLPN